VTGHGSLTSIWTKSLWRLQLAWCSWRQRFKLLGMNTTSLIDEVERRCIYIVGSCIGCPANQT
jgi:hypothetical protein